MAQALWKGGVNFGLVHIPVSLHSAEDSREGVSFHMLDERDHARIKYVRLNKETGEEVPWEHIVKGYEFEPERYVVVTESDLKGVRLESTSSIELESFVALDEVAPQLMEKPYFLVPGKGGEKGYAILRAALSESGVAGVGRVVLRQKERIALVVAFKESLQIILLRYAEELRTEEEAGVPLETLRSIEITDREVKIAKTLIRELTAEWDPAHYTDRYAGALHEMIEEKIAHAGKAPRTSKGAKRAPVERGKVIDIAELLQRSLEDRAKNKGRRSQERKRA